MKTHDTDYLFESVLDTSVSQKFQHIPPSALFRLIRFSPQYDPDFEICKATMQIGAEDHAKNIIDIVSRKKGNDIEIQYSKPSGSTMLKFTYMCRGMMKARGAVFPVLKNIFMGKIPKSLFFKAEALNVTLPTNATLEICNLFKVCKQFESTKSLQGFQPYSKDDINKMPESERKEIATHVQQVQESCLAEMSLTGMYDDLKIASIAINDAGLPYSIDMDKVDVLNFSKILQQPTIVSILSIADNILASQNDMSVDSIVNDFRDKRIASKYNSIAKNNVEFKKQMLAYKKAVADGKTASQPSLNEIDPSKITSLQQLIDIGKNSGASIEGIPNYARNPVANRRLKLFRDAMKFGAKIYYNNDWIVAMCATPRAAALWGRAKPKVYVNADGSLGDIIEYANQTDEEIDGDARIPLEDKAVYKQIRDSNSHDGASIIPSTGQPIRWQIVQDNLDGDGRVAETTWCTAGAGGMLEWKAHDDPASWWFNYNQTENVQDSSSIDGRRPYWPFMDLSTGILYQYSNGYDKYSKIYVKKILDEGDNSRGYGGDVQMAKGMLEAYKSLADLIFPLDINSKSTVSLRDIVENDDGSVVVVDKEHVRPALNATSFYGTEALDVDMENASYLFQGLDLTGISKLILRRVKNAKGMFKNAKLPKSLEICASGNIENADEMFQNSIGLQAIHGLDLRRCKTARGCFRGLVGFHNKPMQVQNVISIPKCEDVSYMFFSSCISKINIADFDNVKYATSFCQHCPYLEQIPDLRFPKVNSANDLVTQSGDLSFGTLQDDPTLLYAGCDTLFSNFDIEDEAKSVMQYYDWKQPNSTPQYDSNGYIVLHGRGEIDQFRKFIPKAPGIKIATDDATQMFANMSLNCGNIDMADVKRADKMFENCQISHIREFQNTDNIESAIEMFLNCRISRFPKLSLIRVQRIDGMLKGIKTMQFPQIVLGPDVDTDMSDPSSVFGELTDDDDIAIRNSLQNVKNWYDENVKDQPRNAVVNSMLENISEDGSNPQYVLHIDNEKQAKVFKNKIFTLENVNSVPEILFSSQKIVKISIGLKTADLLFSHAKLDAPTNEDYSLFSYIDYSGSQTVKIPPIDMHGVRSAVQMFAGLKLCGGSLTLLNTDNITDARGMLARVSMKSVPNMQLPHAVNCKQMFFGSHFDEVPQHNILESLNECINANGILNRSKNVVPPRISLNGLFPKVEDAEYAFNYAKSGNDFLTFQGDVNFPSLTKCYQTFGSCNFEKRAISIAIPSAESTMDMFYLAKFNQSISKISCPQTIRAREMFLHAYDLKFVGKIYMPLCTDTHEMFYNTDLQNVGLFVMSGNGDMTSNDMFGKTPVESIYGRHGNKFINFMRAICAVTQPEN